uniref:C-C motif chemokine 17 n=1 Tax=Maylandia zebra TaxID=106582 RepID=A0A3P9BR53_9CICH
MFLSTTGCHYNSSGILVSIGVQMKNDVQCCMLYSHGKVRTKDVLRFEVQTEGPDCSIQAIILYTKKAVKCADPRDRKVKRLLRKLIQRQRDKARQTKWFLSDNLPVMSESIKSFKIYQLNKTKE